MFQFSKPNNNAAKVYISVPTTHPTSVFKCSIIDVRPIEKIMKDAFNINRKTVKRFGNKGGLTKKMQY